MLDKLVENGNGYILTSQAVANGVSGMALAEYVKKRHMERVAHGLYIAEDAWPDELFRISVLNKRAFFSHETALYLHGLMEREPSIVSVSVRKGYNATHLRKQGIRVYQVRSDVAELGLTEVRTNAGNPVMVFDMERTICDIISCKDDMDIQIFQYAMKEYMARKEKNLGNLMDYAKKIRVESAVRLYTEVML
ncbi:MAG: abortive phage infection protein [Roseburia sp.]|nr:abortive phage infection protein [Roseburia sp.]